MLVRAPVGFRHEHPILAQDCKLRRPFFHGLFIFDIACPCLNGRAAPRWYVDHFEGIGQSFADQVDAVTAMNATARSRAFIVQFYMPAAYSLGCTTACLEEAAIEKPAVDA